MLGFGAVSEFALGGGPKSGASFIMNSDGTFTLANVDHTGVTDNSNVINSAINSIYQSYGGGKLWLPRPGGYLASNIVMRGSVTLQGHGQKNTSVGAVNRDQDVFIFDSSCDYAGLRDIWALGRFNSGSNLTGNCVNVVNNVPVILRDCHIWGGRSAINTSGVDGVIEDCFILGWEIASITSHGANWYRRCKVDTSGNSLSYGFFQGTPTAIIPPGSVAENHFEQSDFSGSYQKSIYVADGGTNSALTVFDGCVISSPIDLAQQRTTMFSGCEFGSTSFTIGSGTTSIIGSVKLGPTLSVPSAAKAANINIV